MNTSDPTGRITQAELARRLKVSRGAVCKAVKSGRITPDEDGLFDPVETELAWIANTQQSARREAGPGKAAKRGQSDYAQARARKEHALARMAELRLMQATGALYLKEDVNFAVRDAFRTLASMLEDLPYRVAPQLVAMRDYGQILSLLENSIIQIRHEIADHFERKMREQGIDDPPVILDEKDEGGDRAPTR